MAVSMSLLTPSLLLLSAAVCAGCAVTNVSTAANEEMPADYRVNFPFVERASVQLENSDDIERPFVGVSISGGGTRAALFGWNVLHELSRAGILDLVDSVSSVSGGSLAGATFALYGKELQTESDWDKYEQLLSHDYLSELEWQLLNPLNWAKMATTDFERTHIMAASFDSRIFKGATFDALGVFRPGSPKLFLNATGSGHANSGQFTFDEDTFLAIGSRLDTYPLAQSVMASGAFPGVFGNINLKVYGDRKIDFHKRIGDPIQTYYRVYDGGGSDNLGVWPLLKRARQKYAASIKAGKRMKGCLFIVIDASTPNYLSIKKGYDADSDHSALDLVVKSTAWESIDALLNVNRLKTLQSLGLELFPPLLDPKEAFLPVIQVLSANGGEPALVPSWRPAYNPVGHFQLFGPRTPWGGDEEDRSIEPSEAELRQAQATGKPLLEVRAQHLRAAREGAPACFVWHLAFSRIRSVGRVVFSDNVPFANSPRPANEYWTYQSRDSANGKAGGWKGAEFPQFESSRVPELAQVYGYRDALSGLMGTLKTSYRLEGPKGCSQDFLVSAIKSTARLLVREDSDVLGQVCQWLNNMDLKSTCAGTKPLISTKTFREDWNFLTEKSELQNPVPHFFCKGTPFPKMDIPPPSTWIQGESTR